MSYEAPFAGLRVVDLSQGVAGPYAAMLLGLYGADVVKVEPPEGDWSRTLGTRYGDQTAFSIAANLGKRSIAVDLKTPEGQEIVRRLIARGDVFLEGFRPGVAAKLGVGYDAVSGLNPRILYMSVSGFGQTGPYRERPAVDTILQSFTGLMSVNKGMDGIPHRVGAIVADMGTALCAFQAIAVALYARRDEPRGRYLEASLMQGVSVLQTVGLMTSHREGGTLRPGLAPSGVYRAADGWITVTILREADFGKLCDVLEQPALKADPRFVTNVLRVKHLPALNEALHAAFGTRTTAEWSARLAPALIMHERMNEYVDFLKHPHVEATGLIAWLEQPEIGRVPVPHAPGITPLVDSTARATAPSLDQHRKEILADLGLV
jgi:crotonobetainyl-CoA:carnitine CoA-transferase CaiB-like acyl-CoA transferase